MTEESGLPADGGALALVNAGEDLPKKLDDPPAGWGCDCELTLVLAEGRAMLAKGFLGCDSSLVEEAAAADEGLAGGRAMDAKGLDLPPCS